MHRIVQFLKDLAETETAGDITALMTETRKALGYRGFSYAGLRPSENSHGTAVYLSDGMVALSDQSMDWVMNYVNKNHQHNDPVVRASISQTLPLVWGPDFMAGYRSTGEEEMMADAYEWGLRHGITVVVRSSTGTLGLLSLTALEAVPDPDGSLTQLFHLIAIHLHEHAQAKLGAEEIQPVILARRELDVLMWSAEGKTAGEIADILDISTRTVNAYIASAMEKLGVYSKTHAVARFLAQKKQPGPAELPSGSDTRSE